MAITDSMGVSRQTLGGTLRRQEAGVTQMWGFAKVGGFRNLVNIKIANRKPTYAFTRYLCRYAGMRTGSASTVPSRRTALEEEKIDL